MSEKVLVTGCTGLVGQGIVRYLLNSGYSVIGTSRQKIRSLHPNFESLQMDLRDEVLIESSVIEEVSAVIHTAAIIPGVKKTPPLTFFEVNFMGTVRMLELAVGMKVPRFIFISSTGVVSSEHDYDEVKSSYILSDDYYTSKATAEMACIQYHNQKRIAATILRIRAPYGYRLNGNSVIPRFINQACNHQDITLWGTGTRRQVFTFVDDIGMACELAIKRKEGGIFNICGESSVSMNELANKILKIFGPENIKIMYTGHADPEEGKTISVTIEKARKILSYIPEFDLEKGLVRVKEMSNADQFYSAFDADEME